MDSEYAPEASLTKAVYSGLLLESYGYVTKTCRRCKVVRRKLLLTSTDQWLESSSYFQRQKLNAEEKNGMVVDRMKEQQESELGLDAALP